MDIRMSENRSSRRQRTALNGRLVFNNRSSVLDCAVRNLSATGAWLTFPEISELPPEFELEIPNRGLRVLARLVWSRGANHGVAFVDAPKA